MPRKLTGALQSSIYTGHRPALFCAASACLGTFSAMFHSMLCVFLTFFSASVTNLSASMTEQRSMFATNPHQTRTCIASFRTFAIQFNASGEHAYVFFIQTFRGAVVAFCCTRDARVYAALISFVTHTFDFLVEQFIYRGYLAILLIQQCLFGSRT